MLSRLLAKTQSKEFCAIVIACCVTFLCVVGILTVYSVTSVGNVESGTDPLNDLAHQIAFVVAGVGICVLLARLPQIFNIPNFLIWTIWAFCVALVVYVAINGTTVNGAKRWLTISGITFQPSEFLKIAVMLMMVKILGEHSRGEVDSRNATILILVTCAAPLVFLLVTQRDLGSSFVLFATLVSLLYLANIRGDILAGIVILAGVALVVELFFRGGYRSERMSFINPWDDGEGGYGSGYNIIRSYYAIASGGIFGNGIGASHEKYDYLYAADNDFIFAVICEEMGFVGGVLVVICVLAIFLCCVQIACAQEQTETKLVAYGAGLLLLIQSLLNIGCTVGVLPTTGKPLPFVSSGGSSILASFILLGIIFNSVTHAKVVTQADKKRSKINIYSKVDAEEENEVVPEKKRTGKRRADRSRPRFDF